MVLQQKQDMNNWGTLEIHKQDFLPCHALRVGTDPNTVAASSSPSDDIQPLEFERSCMPNRMMSTYTYVRSSFYV